MENWINILANANHSIVEPWAIFITVNTATIGWVLSKKTAFLKHHVIIAIIGYGFFTFSILNIVEAKYEYRNVVLADFKLLFSERSAQKNEYPFYLIKDGKSVPTELSKYILNKPLEYKTSTYFWLFICWFFISFMFYLDSKGQFHMEKSKDDKAN